MFVYNAWYVAAEIAEVTETPFLRTLLDEPVVLARDAAGQVYALEDRCCHRAAPLSIGTMTETGLQCRYHGFTYNATGTCVSIPGHTGKIPERARVRSFPVAEKGDFVWIWMGDPVKADADEIIDYPPSHLGLRPRTSMLPVKGSYVLLIENLMDLTHLSYLHVASIGSSRSDAANAEMNVERTPNGVKFQRVMRNCVTPPAYREQFGLDEYSDRGAVFEYVAPAFVLQHTVLTMPGELEKAMEEGLADRGVDTRLLHACTPETERSCHYFFTKTEGYELIAPPGFKPVESIEVFKEDAWMVEHQQRRLEGYDPSRLVDGPSDIARVQMTRVLQERLAAEHGTGAAAAE